MLNMIDSFNITIPSVGDTANCSRSVKKLSI